MEGNLGEAAAVINYTKTMRKFITLSILFISIVGYSQSTTNNTEYKKRVLETAEVDIISSFYSQDGDNAAVTGGIGTEKLKDIATSFVVSIPLNDDDVFIIDATISAYTSASSSNLDPFDVSSASSDDSDSDSDNKSSTANHQNLATNAASPWIEYSGA